MRLIYLFSVPGPARTDSVSSHDSVLNVKSETGGATGTDIGAPAGKNQRDFDWGQEDDFSPQSKTKKQSSQIAKELSDLVIYIQVRFAVKIGFQLNTCAESKSRYQRDSIMKTLFFSEVEVYGLPHFEKKISDSWLGFLRKLGNQDVLVSRPGGKPWPGGFPTLLVIHYILLTFILFRINSLLTERV